ncbi:MAG TPA: cyclic nucleotide-binding domain-containing protein [Candidatus Acidoferrales bacterium]|nr:cyclic nucleotide-binding domain-containing protein [Candidatus Acidoferrales bacterium]
MAAPTASVWQRLAERDLRRIPETFSGIWGALRERLNPALYRPVRSDQVEAVPLTTRHGQAYYILANRGRSRYLRLAPDDYHLWTLMDGTRSVKDLIFEYFTQFGSLAFDRVAQLVFRLRLDRMLADPVLSIFASVRRMLARMRGHSIARGFWEVISGQRQFRIRRIDGLIEGLHRHGGWLLYTTPVQIVYVGVCLVGGWFFLQHLASGRYDLFLASGSYTKGLFLLYLLNYFSITLHEMGHALTCKHYGAHVNGAGVMLYYGMPAYFIDTTDIWTKPSRARIATSWAGPYSGVILAGLCAIAVQIAPDSPLSPNLHRLSFLWTLILLFNLIPLLELDGYFMLIDWLEIPMLRSRALAFFRKELWHRLRRREPLTGLERLLAWFGGFSFVFSIFVIILAVISWQRRLGALTQSLWGGGVGSKALLVLLVIVLSLPLIFGLVSRTASATRAAVMWSRKWRLPGRRALRQRETLLRAVHFLSPLSDEELSQVATRMNRQTFRPGDIVIRQEAEGDRFYVIEGGAAEVCVGDDREPRRTLMKGDYFGEIALLERVRRTATVRAISRLSVLWLSRGDFDRLLARHVAASARIDRTIRTLEELRQFPILADVPSRELDALASRLVRERFPPGADVIREGDPGDSFYLVASGQAEVLVGGKRVSILGNGSYFGEIALLFDRPRAATVRALTPLDVLKLHRQDFDALVVTTLNKVAAVLEETGRERLASLSGLSLAGQPGKD